MDVRAKFPLTMQYLGGAGPDATSEEEFVRKLCDTYAKGDIPCRAIRDLARYEGLLAELQPVELDRGPPPKDDERVVLASYVRVYVYGAGLPELIAALREEKPAPAPRPSRGWIVAWRDAEGKLCEHVLPRETGWLLESFRQPTAAADTVEDEEDRERFDKLWDLGILVRAG